MREFTIRGAADPARVRSAALIDFAAGFVVAVLAFPFPIARAVLPLPVFVLSILGSIVLAHVLYCTLTARLLGRTPGMYLLDLALEGGTPAWGAALLWGLGASVAFWPTVFGAAGSFDPATGLPARLSGLTTGSTKERS